MKLRIALVLGCLIAFAARAQEVTPEAELLQKRVEQIHDDPAFTVAGARIAAKRLVPELYARRGFAPAWTDPATRDDLLRAIRASHADGLEPEDYLLGTLLSARSLAEKPDATLDARVDYDLLQSEALTRLLYHVIFGKVDPRSLDPNWNFTRELHREDATAFVQEVIDSKELYARVEREYPQYQMYRDLKAELARERAVEVAGDPAAIAPGPTLKPGVDDPRVIALRKRLQAVGETSSDSTLYDATVEAAVSAFQARNGLEPDGAVGPATLLALNTPIGVAIDKIRVNLERGRWLLHDLDPTFVVVNVAGFQVYYLRNGELVWSSRVQVGKPFRATPIFRSEINHLVLNPTWTVPPGIFANDILPAQKRDGGTLARKKLEVIDHAGRPVPASSIDWANTTPRNFRYMLRQGPGPDNALGRVKFMFPNSYSVYLHDTPSRALFAKSDRAFSSGCIRVENPLELATLLLDGQPGWDRAAIDRAVAAGTTRSVTLAKPVPVLLTYWTAWVDRAGVFQQRADIYKRDPKVLKGLDAEFAFKPRKS